MNYLKTRKTYGEVHWECKRFDFFKTFSLNVFPSDKHVRS